MHRETLEAALDAIDPDFTRHVLAPTRLAFDEITVRARRRRAHEPKGNGRSARNTDIVTPRDDAERLDDGDTAMRTVTQRSLHSHAS